MDLQNTLEGLTDDKRERARALKTPEEIIAFAKEEGLDISDDMLEAVAGGGWSLNCDDEVINT